MSAVRQHPKLWYCAPLSACKSRPAVHDPQRAHSGVLGCLKAVKFSEPAPKAHNSSLVDQKHCGWHLISHPCEVKGNAQLRGLLQLQSVGTY